LSQWDIDLFEEEIGNRSETAYWADIRYETFRGPLERSCSGAFGCGVKSARKDHRGV
jgi:hypothetical protein